VLEGFLISLGMLLVVILDPNAATVYAANMFGALRAPGEPAFVAGHRGDRADAPENTLPAFAAGLASSLDFVELDVQLSADGVPVIIHDPTVDRTTNGTGAVADLTLAELESLDAGSWFASSFVGTRIPTFAEFLDIFTGSHKKALVELKGRWTADQVMLVTDQVFRAGVQNRVVLMSFDFTTLFNMERTAPTIPRIVILRALPPDPVEFAASFGAIAILTTPKAIEPDPTVIDTMHAAGLGILLYTLNKQSRWSSALALGVDGIVTDKPSRLDKWLADTAPGT
jgi:glycerophosphoryl diester phosphodiesterase